jgi:hypothetical protein
VNDKEKIARLHRLADELLWKLCSVPFNMVGHPNQEQMAKEVEKIRDSALAEIKGIMGGSND